MLRETPTTWSVNDARDLYQVDRWGKGFFSVHRNGHLLVHPDRHPQRAVDLKQLVDRLQKRVLTLGEGQLIHDGQPEARVNNADA